LRAQTSELPPSAKKVSFFLVLPIIFLNILSLNNISPIR